MNKVEIGEFLYRFYRKRTSSFLANIYKASITSESKDIHRARLDVKKIFAMYGLFEMLEPEVFKHQGGYKLFRPLFRQAGKIREIQVNYLLLSNSPSPGENYPSFIKWLEGEERRAVEKFLQQVRKFREKELANTDKVIRKICYGSSIVKLRSKTMVYNRQKIAQINEMKMAEPTDREIHQMRQKLKMMSTISTLVYSIKPGQQLDQIISALNKTEMMIGDWHDRVVLNESIDRFLELKKPESKGEQISLNQLKQRLLDSNKNLVHHFMPELNEIVRSVLKERELAKSE